ncbi:MAG: hypothetical protein KF784_01600 [Fimbriimonadaceae bacterium]|nr:hypothetical protein [Fimbriimonadaceae bacterium]
MNCTFLDYEPFCRAALSQSSSLELGPVQVDKVREAFEAIFPEIDQAVCACRPEVLTKTLRRRTTLALYGFISVACADDLSDSEIESIVGSLFVSKQLVAA